MTRTLTAVLVAGLAAAPAFAVEDMTCADFAAMSPEEQTETVSMMMEGMPEGGMMAEDGMAEGGMMAEDGGMMAEGAMEEGGMAEGGMMAGDAMAAEDAARRVAAACAEHPDMMLGEAMRE